MLMEKLVKVHVLNNDRVVEVPIGSNLDEVYQAAGVEIAHGPI